jgi:hypothetical protein
MRQLTRIKVPCIVVGMICLLLVPGCPGGGGGGGRDSNSDKDTSGNIKTKTYMGTADIIIDYYDYDFFGNLIFLEQKSYQYDVEVVTGPPKNVGSVYEQNAINLQIMTTSMGGEGTFGISSAILNVALQGDPVLLQYWNLNYTNQLIDGTLVDTHIAESAAANQLYAREDLAGFVSVLLFFMDTGTDITGSLSSDIADIQIDGQTTDGTRIFSIDIQASS